ncbi:transcriptional regulator [Actinopolymorpha singaporensis]
MTVARRAAPATAADLDPVIHPTNRLRICALLHAAQEVEFGTLQKEIGVSASALSKQLSHLQDAGYVEKRRVLTDSRHHVWLKLTRGGRSAYTRHIAALRAILETAG